MSQHFVLCSYHDRSLMRLARGRIGEGGEGEECQAAGARRKRTADWRDRT